MIVAVSATLLLLSSCYKDETLNVPVKDDTPSSTSELDQYIQKNFTEEYGMAIRYKFIDRYVDPQQRVTPPKIEVVKPMLDFITNFWIAPFKEVKNGETFFRNHVPAEIILLGGLIYNEDGTVILGQADAGARITFTDVNDLDLTDKTWVLTQLHTVFHEFAHIVHQRYRLPPSFENISPNGYTSAGSWFTLSDAEALDRGFVSPYATSDPNEDFAETVAFFLTDVTFYQDYIDLETDCTTNACEVSNEGKKKIAEKLNAIETEYEKVVGVNLEDVRNAVLAKLQGL